MALDPNTNQLFVANSESANLTVIDTLLNTVSIKSVNVGADPVALADDARDGLVYVANAGNSFLTAINVSHPATQSVNVPLYDGPATGLAFSPHSDMILATIASSQYATLVEAAEEATLDALLPVGRDMVPVVTSTNGTEFVLGNESGNNVIVLNSSTGATIDSGIQVGRGVSELVADPTTGMILCWGETNRIADLLNLTTNLATQSTETTYPELTSVSFAQGESNAIATGINEPLVYLLNSVNVGAVAGTPSSPSQPLSVALDSATERFFVGTTTGLEVYNSSTGDFAGTVAGITGNCTQLELDRLGNLLWMFNSISGVIAVNLTTLHVVISTGIVIPSAATQGISIDSTDSETFILASSSAVTVLNSVTGHLMASGISVGTNATSLVFDPADDQIYAAGDVVEFLDGASLAIDGSVAPFGGSHRVLAEAYDASREAVYVSSIGLLAGAQGMVTVIDGGSVASGEGPTVEVPVGEDPIAIAVVPSGGANASGLAMVWVANELSGTISVISTPPEVTFFELTPSTIDLGHSASVGLAFTGGAGTITIAYAGLPSGCLASQHLEWVCTPSSSGVFHLTVNVTDSLGASANATASLTVLAALVLDASFSPSALPMIDVGVPIVGTSSALNGLSPYEYSWAFGDGTIASGARVAHAYASPGAYVVTAQVRDATGATANVSTAVVVVPRPGVEVATAPGNTTDVDFPVELTAVVSGGTGTAQESWTFGDGTEAVGPNVTHAWTRPGVFRATVQYVDALGVAANDSVNITVHPSLSATFASGNVSSSNPATVGTPVPFTSSPSGGTPPYSVTWAFGDGSMATGLSVEHGYATAATFTVAVTLTDAVGASVHTNLTVTIVLPPASSGGISSPGGGFGTGLFLGLIVGGVVAAVVLFLAGSRRGGRSTPPPATPYVPP